MPDAERLTRAHRPSVLVLDLNMHGESGLDAIPRLRETCPETAIVVLTMQDDPAFARRALQSGALGFVLKEAADEELLQAIHLAATGENYLNPRLGARLAAAPAEPAGPPDDLTDRPPGTGRHRCFGGRRVQHPAEQAALDAQCVEQPALVDRAVLTRHGLPR